VDSAERISVRVGHTAARPSAWRLGPGLITGACNDDPSSVATYLQVGAQYGYGLAWTLLLSYPLLVAIQAISARIGRVTGRGFAGNLRLHYPGWLVGTLVGLLAVANIINLAVDLNAMGAVLKLLLDAPALLYVGLLSLASVLFELFTRYSRYVAVLKLLCLSLLSYVVCAFVVDVSWGEVARALVLPEWSREPQYLLAVVAALGTTISPYLFFWQAQQEVEAGRNGGGGTPLQAEAEEAGTEFARIRFDTLVGMGLSSLVALFIVITSASTLHARGITTIQTAAEAAEALRAVGGRFTMALFALGILGGGLLTLPALSNSAGYAVGELLSRPVGPARGPRGAPAFYIVAATAVACCLSFTSVNPMRALYLSAVLNGVIAVPLMIAMMHMCTREAFMGSLRLSGGLAVLGWLATALMAANVIGLTVAVLL
jgi:NRAMP (natural resistance-associated macrophage protein)-like metal ion transporter